MSMPRNIFHAKTQRKTQRRKALPRFQGFLCVFASSFAPLREKILSVRRDGFAGATKPPHQPIPQRITKR
jgi:hypothetical protein